ncbi:MAG: hypothetical protein JNJ49_16870 [Bdellovibrionaceae bacterium]|nr:hypothetical protein [Pseudobdellovibrionaceae bacterium]
MKLKIGFIALLFGINASAQVCEDLFTKIDSSRTRPEITLLARQKNVPNVILQTQNGPIPVLQFNDRTAPALREILGKSLGTLVQLQPGWRNDHGMLRVFDKVIDVDTPGARGFGELHTTGLAWKTLDTWLPRRRGSENTVIEVGYLLSPMDQVTVRYYQTVRRAAIIRVPFTFGGGGAQIASPTRLNDGENCFSFARGSSLSGHIRQMESELRTRTGKSFQELKAVPEVAQFLAKARGEIAALSPDSVKLNDRVALEWQEARALIGKLGGDATLLNWLIGMDATTSYNELFRHLEISGESSFSDMNHRQASFVLVYDDIASKEQFEARDFKRSGIFSTWTHQNLAH